LEKEKNARKESREDVKNNKGRGMRAGGFYHASGRVFITSYAGV